MLDLRHRPWVAAVVLVILLGSSIGLQAFRDRAFPRMDIRERFLYLRSGDALKRIALSYDALVADVYWIRSLQHFGGDRLAGGGAGKYELLYPLLDLTTSLDPRFTVAYRFGAIFLSEPSPGGPGRPDLAVALLRKGIARDPSKWPYMQDIGFVYYWARSDFKEAAGWFHRASQVPGAPEWLQPLAATTLAQGGDRTASRFLWHQILAAADDDWLKREAERRLLQLEAMDQIDWLNARIRPYVVSRSGGAVSWWALVRAGVLPAVPRDPTGEPYVLSEAGTVSVAQRSPLYPLPSGQTVRVGTRR